MAFQFDFEKELETPLFLEKDLKKDNTQVKTKTPISPPLPPS